MESLDGCVFCGTEATRFRAAARRGGYQLVRCPACGLTFVHPRDERTALLAQYARGRTSPAGYYQATAPADREHFRKALRRLEKLAGPGRLLDVGCNVGTFLECARARGWTATGLEANPEACAAARRKGLAVTEGFLDREALRRFEPGGFDCVAMTDVIEHLPDPVESLKGIRPLLKPGGWLLLTTPDFDSFWARLFQIKPREHLFYFNRATLSRVLLASGFDVRVLRSQGRLRALGSVSEGATVVHPALKVASRVLRFSRLDGMVSRILAALFRDELFAIAQRTER